MRKQAYVRWWPLLLGLAWTNAGWAAETCPSGQSRVCVGVCFCAPTDDPLLNQANQMVAQLLSQRIEQSRERVLAAGTQPVPLQIRVQLEPYFDLQVLDSARYRIGDENPANISHALLQNPDVQAVTLVDVLVFRNADAAQNDVALWAHELTHVQQYQALGIAEFTLRYSRDYVQIEAPAYQMQSRVSYALKQAKAATNTAPGPSKLN